MQSSTVHSYVAFIRRARWVIIASCGLVAVAAGLGALKLGFNPDARVYFGNDTPELRNLEAFEERHGRGRNAVFLIRPAEGSVLARTSLQAMADLSHMLRDEPGTDHVRSVVDLTFNARQPGTPAGSTGPPARLDADDVRRIEAFAADNPGLLAPLLAPDHSLAAVSVTLTPEDADPHALNRSVARLYQIRDRVEPRFEDLAILLTGSAVQDATFMTAIQRDLVALAPVQVAIIVILLLMGIGCPFAALALLSVLGVSTALLMGAIGWLGGVLNGVTSAVPTVLMGLSIASAMHIVLTWQQGRTGGLSALQAIEHALEANSVPVTIAIVTTIVSFLCLNFSQSPPFREFGTLVAIGLAVVWVLSFTLLPALLLALPCRSDVRRNRVEHAMARLGRVVAQRWQAILGLFIVLTGLLTFGATQIVFSDNFAHYFDRRFEFRRATDLYEEKISGILTVDFSIAAAAEGGVLQPEFLRDLRAFRASLASREDVVRVDSLDNLLGRLSENLPDFMRQGGLPATADAAQLLLEGYRDAGGAKEIGRLVTPRMDHTRITVTLDNVPSGRLLEFASFAEARLASIDPAHAAPATGIAILAAHMSKRNTISMVAGTSVALSVVSLVMVFALGSLRQGLMSLVPNLFPLLAAYGVWGLLVGEVSFAATVVSAMTFGIVVDDTVHFMIKYRRARQRDGLTAVDAVAESFRTVGLAISMTSIAVALGFLTLALSGFMVNQHLGLMTLMTLFAALAACLFFLPPLLVALARTQPSSKSGDVGR